MTAGPPQYVRILVGAPGRKRVTIVDAATGRRERDINADQLHPYPVGPRGGQHRRGYVHTATREWVEHLVDQALHDHPFTIAGSSIAQNPWRGGFLRLQTEVTLPAVRAIVAALEAASWTVEPSTVAEDELRVRLRGQLTCPATHSSGAGRWYCDLDSDHRHEHRDNEALETWDDDTPEPAAWWLPGQPHPGHAPAGV
ncbi:hypothetical protein [Streptomyces californicus]|uniref:hypothetical protein n=1 Tax=Streptomyces californicus TaxID=67351 RepID=UPI00296EB400|nr:hypothetical protein [Streptomyces californicus]MDW4918689.1 hypothetical protein [Streptomyces californicus]